MNGDEKCLNFPINECPYCGSEFFIRRIRFKGFGIEVYKVMDYFLMIIQVYMII